MCYSEFNDIIEAIAQMDADVITIETSRSDMELLDKSILEQIIISVLSGLNDMSHFPDQVLSLFNFSFNGELISNISSHKYLGVTLSHCAKWSEHVENIAKTISKHLGVLRKLKFNMNRLSLEKMYLVYVRPIFEYACEAWDNCGT
jgi:hypothetical protein